MMQGSQGRQHRRNIVIPLISPPKGKAVFEGLSSDQLEAYEVLPFKEIPDP